MRLSPRDFLNRWLTVHLGLAGCERTVEEFSRDLRDGAVYAHLLSRVGLGGGVDISSVRHRLVGEANNALLVVRSAAYSLSGHSGRLGCLENQSERTNVRHNLVTPMSTLFSSHQVLDDAEVSQAPGEVCSRKQGVRMCQGIEITPT